MSNSPRFWARLGGAGGVVFFISLAILIVLMPLSHSVAEPGFDASASAFLAYGKSQASLPFALELLGVLGLFGFLFLPSRWQICSAPENNGRMRRLRWS